MVSRLTPVLRTLGHGQPGLHGLLRALARGAPNNRCCEVGVTRSGAPPVARMREMCRASKPRGPIGARGVETISAIALVHIQPVATSSDVGRSRNAAAGERAVLGARVLSSGVLLRSA